MDRVGTHHAPVLGVTEDTMPDPIDLDGLERCTMEQLNRIDMDMQSIAVHVTGLPLADDMKEKILSDIRFFGWSISQFEIFCQIYKSNARSDTNNSHYTQSKCLLTSIRRLLLCAIAIPGVSKPEAKEINENTSTDDIKAEITELIRKLHTTCTNFKWVIDKQNAVDRTQKTQIQDLRWEAERHQGKAEDFNQRYHGHKAKIDELDAKLKTANNTIDAQAARINELITNHQTNTTVHNNLLAELARHRAQTIVLQQDVARLQGERTERQNIVDMIRAAMQRNEATESNDDLNDEGDQLIQRRGSTRGRFWCF